MPSKGIPLSDLLPSWQLSLEDRKLQPATIEIYMRTGRKLVKFLAKHDMPADTEGIEVEHLRAFLRDEGTRTKPVSVHQHWRNLRVLFKWLAKEGERTGPNPTTLLDPPEFHKKVKGILGSGQVAALLKTCQGTPQLPSGRRLTRFEQLRDEAIIRIFIDTGVRVSGVGDMLKTNVKLPQKTILVVLKGGDEHLIPLGRRTTAALDRYLRIRARSPRAASPWLWIGLRGTNPDHFGAAGIQDMLERRSEMAGIEKITPHWFRRTFAHDWLDSGGSEVDAMSIAGWKTRAMVAQYAGDLAAERAREAHARQAPGDRF